MIREGLHAPEYQIYLQNGVKMRISVCCEWKNSIGYIQSYCLQIMLCLRIESLVFINSKNIKFRPERIDGQYGVVMDPYGGGGTFNLITFLKINLTNNLLHNSLKWRPYPQVDLVCCDANAPLRIEWTVLFYV